MKFIITKNFYCTYPQSIIFNEHISQLIYINVVHKKNLHSYPNQPTFIVLFNITMICPDFITDLSDRILHKIYRGFVFICRSFPLGLSSANKIYYTEFSYQFRNMENLFCESMITEFLQIIKKLRQERIIKYI